MQAAMILKRNTKNQAPNTKKIPNSKLQTAARASTLELGALMGGLALLRVASFLRDAT